MNKHLLALLGTTCLGFGNCSGWEDTSPTDPKLGEALRVAGDPNAPRVTDPKKWPTCVILANRGVPAKIAFRDYHGHTKVYTKQTIGSISGYVALHIGPEDVEFMFYLSADHPAPELLSRRNPCDLSDYPDIIEP